MKFIKSYYNLKNLVFVVLYELEELSDFTSWKLRLIRDDLVAGLGGLNAGDVEPTGWRDILYSTRNNAFIMVNVQWSREMDLLIGNHNPVTWLLWIISCEDL